MTQHYYLVTPEAGRGHYRVVTSDDTTIDVYRDQKLANWIAYRLNAWIDFCRMGADLRVAQLARLDPAEDNTDTERSDYETLSDIHYRISEILHGEPKPPDILYRSERTTFGLEIVDGAAMLTAYHMTLTAHIAECPSQDEAAWLAYRLNAFSTLAGIRMMIGMALDSEHIRFPLERTVDRMADTFGDIDDGAPPHPTGSPI